MIDPPASRLITEKSVINYKESRHSITKDIVLGKFSGKQQNAGAWLHLFIEECNPIEITKTNGSRR